LNLLLRGYYQSAVLPIRDIVETSFLLHYFGLDRAKIKEWRHSDDKALRKNFKPSKLRKALDARDGFTSGMRDKAYWFLSEYGVHPTPAGAKLITLKGLGVPGPFFSEKHVKGTVEELSKYLANAAAIYIDLFPDADAACVPAGDAFVASARAWLRKYFSTHPAGVE
jgi:hypothetical protein